MEQFFKQPFTLDRTVRTVLFILCLCVIIGLISAIWEVLLPFLLAGIFAYVFMPLVRFFQDRLRIRNRAVSVMLVFLLVIGLLVFATLYLIPAIQEEIAKTIEVLKAHSGGESSFNKLLPPNLKRLIERQFDLSKLFSGLSVESLVSTGESLWDKAGGIISSTLSVFSWGLVFAMGIIYFVFIMIDFEGLAYGLIDLFPQSGRSTIKSILKEVDYYMNSYFRGQALIALTVGVLLAIGFSLIGLPLAIVLGIFIGLLNFIPYMQALGIIPLGLSAVLMALQNGESILVSFAFAYGVLFLVQIIQDSFLVPKIMGAKMGMRPSLILLALSVWGYLFGFFGMLIALPATMSLYAIYMRYVLRDSDYIALMEQKLNPSKEKSQSNTP